MADSTNPFDIPAGQFQLVAGYIDGLYAWPAAGWKYHASSIHVTITCTTADLNAMVADVEPGCLTTAEGVAWALAKFNGGQHPTLYFSVSRWPEIDRARKAAGLPDGSFSVWGANWTGVSHLDFNDAATQWADGAMIGTHYDVSAVADYWPGIDPPPTQPPVFVPPVSGAAAGDLFWTSVTDLVTGILPDASNRIAAAARNLGAL